MRLIDAKELAAILAVSESRAYQLLREGLVPVVRLGRQVRVNEDALRTFIEAGGRSLPGGWRRQPLDENDAGS